MLREEEEDGSICGKAKLPLRALVNHLPAFVPQFPLSLLSLSGGCAAGVGGQCQALSPWGDWECHPGSTGQGNNPCIPRVPAALPTPVSSLGHFFRLQPTPGRKQTPRAAG